MKAGLHLDPRTELLLLLAANVIAFTQPTFWLETAWIAFLCMLTALCGKGRMSVKWLLTFGMIVALQNYILPVSPKIVATSFSTFVNYMRRMLSCAIIGMLMVKTTPLRELIVALRKWRLPQKLIIAISVTLRYFPAIREETGYICDSMRLRNVRGLQKVEALVVPLMISATGTAEELSAAAVTRGIENPVPKTSVVELRIGAADWVCITVGVLFAAASCLIG